MSHWWNAICGWTSISVSLVGRWTGHVLQRPCQGKQTQAIQGFRWFQEEVGGVVAVGERQHPRQPLQLSACCYGGSGCPPEPTPGLLLLEVRRVEAVARQQRVEVA